MFPQTRVAPRVAPAVSFTMDLSRTRWPPRCQFRDSFEPNPLAQDPLCLIDGVAVERRAVQKFFTDDTDAIDAACSGDLLIWNDVNLSSAGIDNESVINMDAAKAFQRKGSRRARRAGPGYEPRSV